MYDYNLQVIKSPKLTQLLEKAPKKEILYKVMSYCYPNGLKKTSSHMM